jgi:hypothetical protein
VTADGAAGAPWPDPDEERRWQQALAGAAARIREERGVEDPWRLTVGCGALWAEYGDLRMQVSGAGTGVPVLDGLFEDIDHWVAFERAAGPGRVLDRDERAMAEWRNRLPELQRFWEGIARRVFADVEATTDLRLPWQITVHEDEWDLRGMPAGDGMWLRPGTDPLPRRPLAFPQVWLETPHTGRGLYATTHEDEALRHLADLVQEDVIDELHGAWPPCPRHAHPLEVASDDAGRAVWRCRTTPSLSVAVGALGRPPAAGTGTVPDRLA